MVMAPPSMHDSAVSPCFHACLAFLHRIFPPQSPPSRPFDPSLHSQQQPSPWDCSTIFNLQFLVNAPCRELCVPIQGIYGCGKDCLILIPFMLPQISCFTLSLKYFSSDSDSCPGVGIVPLLQFPHPSREGPVLLILPPGSFVLPSFAWFCIFFSTGQVLLPIFSWCSAFTSVSEGVFLMNPWREVYSTSANSSTILFSPVKLFNIKMIFKRFQGFCLERTSQYQQCRTYI